MVHRIRSKGGGGGGDVIIIPPGIGFTDEFSLRINFTDSNASPSDDLSVAFEFPESIDAQSDVVQLGIPFTDSNASQTDVEAFLLNFAETDSVVGQSDIDTYAISFAQSETVNAQSEAVSLGFSGSDFSDSMAAPTDARSAVIRVWLSGSAGTGVGTPANANGQNDAANAVVQTAALGATTETLTSALGVNIPSGITFSSAIYRGWVRFQTSLVTSTARLVAHSTTAAFTDITMFTQSTLGGDTNHLTGTFTFDLVAAGVNTLAKLQSLEIIHSTTDALAGVSPATVTVDAGAVDIVATSI